ncbi:hypothetical protein GQ53DRAFT_746467 [Thozetella sp. PMI_491]|nr:hypothetical protein GQ53DRAFT_746467 [Thozetella sp. PMI_491]
MRSVFGFGIPNHSVGSSPDFPRPATAMLGYPAAAQRAVSYAAPPRYNHNSGRKFSGQKSSGAARFNYFDEDTPTRPGSGFRDSSMTQVLAPRPVGDEDRLSAEWRDRFGKLWTAVAGYCRTYVAGENKNLHLFLQANAPNVWQYICDVLYPNNPTTAGSSHAQILLADLESRAYLVQRLVIQYFINQMWCAEGWNQFNEDTDRGLKLAEDNLKTLESMNPPPLFPHGRFL